MLHCFWISRVLEGTLTRLSGGFRGDPVSHGEYPVLTPDGRSVVFLSSQPDLLPDDADQNLRTDVFRRAVEPPAD